MGRRLQIVIPEGLAARIERALERDGASRDAWIRRAIEAALERQVTRASDGSDPLLRLASLGAPTAAIDDMIAEIGSGRR